MAGPQQLPEGMRGYNGSTILKGANQKMGWTAHQISEWIKCKNDPIYFASKYMKIVTLDKGLVNFEMWDFQKEIVKTVMENRMSLIATSRQAGKTQTCCAFVLHYILFNSLKTVAILANKGATAREILTRVQNSYQHLPYWLQQGVVEFNKGSFLLENGSRVLAAATSSDSIRGYTVSLCVLDECAFIENFDEFFLSTMPTISSGKDSKIVMISTPNGLNHFYKFWVDSIEGRNDYARVMADWTKIPGRDQAWADKMRRALGSDERFLQEFCVEFAGSADTLIPGSVLKKIVYDVPIIKEEQIGLSIYKKPEKDHRYVMTIDTSRGAGFDYSAVSVFDVSVMPYDQVATIRHNKLFPYEFAEACFRIGTMYNKAFMMIELNDLGQQVADLLFQQYEYDNLFSTATNGRDGVVLSTKSYKGSFGIKTTETTKRIGCGNLRTHLMGNKIRIRDYNTVQELGTFKKKGETIRFEAEKGYHDDLVMTLVIFSWVIEQPNFSNDFAGEVISYQDRVKAVEDQLLPLGGSFNGTEADVWFAGSSGFNF